MMHIAFPLGYTFGKAFDRGLQTRIVKDLLDFAVKGRAEELVKLSYRWNKK